MWNPFLALRQWGGCGPRTVVGDPRARHTPDSITSSTPGHVVGEEAGTRMTGLTAGLWRLVFLWRSAASQKICSFLSLCSLSGRVHKFGIQRQSLGSEGRRGELWPALPPAISPDLQGALASFICMWGLQPRSRGLSCSPFLFGQQAKRSRQASILRSVPPRPSCWILASSQGGLWASSPPCCPQTYLFLMTS